MAPLSRLVSDAELEILKALWEHGPGTVRDVQAHTSAPQAYTTTQTLLNRLRDKGFVDAAKEGRAFVFHAVVSRDELLDQSLRTLAERVCGGASMPLLLNLLQSSRFSADELDRFRALLDELEDGERR